MTYKQLIKNWHTKASNEDYFSKFMFEYLAFMAHLRTQRYTTSNNDRDVLQLLKNDNELKDAYFQKTGVREAYIALKSELDDVRLGNASGLRTVEEIQWWNHICRADSFCGAHGCGDIPDGLQSFEDEMKGRLYGEQDWANLIELWRAVRDNLFHGSKNPDVLRDQKMVEFGHKTLQPLVEILITEQL